jgi:hypothetical protein
MCRWESEHPDTRLDRVMANIRTGIENGQDLILLIPDSPFPARSLIQAMGVLVTMGIVIFQFPGHLNF